MTEKMNFMNLIFGSYFGETPYLITKRRMESLIDNIKKVYNWIYNNKILDDGRKKTLLNVQILESSVENVPRLTFPFLDNWGFWWLL